MAELPIERVPHLAASLAGVVDVEGKIPRALAALGPLEGRAVALLDAPGAPFLATVQAAGAADPLVVAVDGNGTPLTIAAPEGSLDFVVTLWTAFRGVAAADLAEVDRVLRPGGRLLVVHDYGRDDVSLLRDPGLPEYARWSRREGPFLRGGGFRIRVVHCFWTFEDLDVARATLDELFGERGRAVGERLKRPRLSWNVAVYHRWRGGTEPPAADAAGAGTAAQG